MSNLIHTALTFSGQEADFWRAVEMRTKEMGEEPYVAPVTILHKDDGRTAALFDSAHNFEVCIARALSLLLPYEPVEIMWIEPVNHLTGTAVFVAGQLVRFVRRDGDRVTRFDATRHHLQEFDIVYASPDEAPYTDDFIELLVNDDHDARVQVSCFEDEAAEAADRYADVLFAHGLGPDSEVEQ